MDVERLWPHLPDEWHIGRAVDLVAIAKPSEVDEAPRVTAGGNDVLIRLVRACGHRADAPEVEGWQSILSPIAKPRRGRRNARSCSGVVCIALQPGAMAEFVNAQTQGGVAITYVAGVENWPHRGTAAEAGVEGGLATMGVGYRVLRQKGRRALLELTTTTDEIDIARAIRKLGYHVSGDESGDQAERTGRMFLHRRTVTWGTRSFEAPLPAAFSRFLDGAPEILEERLGQALRRRYALARDPATSSFRLLDDERDMTIDRYGEDLVLSCYSNLDERTDAATFTRAIAAENRRAAGIGETLGARRVYLKIRPKQANTIVNAAAAGLAPKEPVWGPSRGNDERAIAVENDVRYWVKLGQGLGTGLFLDQRDNRRWIRDHATDKRILNTFAYTCAFSVAAAVGGARRTVSIDAAAPALEVGRANFALNDADDPQTHDTIRGDVFNWLPRMARRGDRFDVVILDPPSYSRVRKRRFSAMRDYADLVATAVDLLDEGGWLLASVNHTKMSRRRLHQAVIDGCGRRRRKIVAVEHRICGVDHPSGRMKSLLARVA